MTVETSVRKQSFAGGQNTLEFSFKTLAGYPSYIKAVKTLIASGIETDLTYDSDYTVSVNSDGVGGIVTMTPSVSTLYIVTVYRETEDKQESDYDDYNQFPADTLEADLDRRTLVSQEASEETARTLKLGISYTGSSISMSLPSDGAFLSWLGGNIVNSTVASQGGLVLSDNEVLGTSSTTVVSERAIRANVSSYVVTFGSAALSSGILVVNHNLSKPYPFAVIYDENNKMIGFGDEYEVIDDDTLNINFSSMLGDIANYWKVRIF
jgi:hypothetical protein